MTSFVHFELALPLLICFGYHIVFFGSDSSVRQIAKRLLDKEVNWCPHDVGDRIEIIHIALREVCINDMHLNWLFDGRAYSHEDREELFGFGRGHIGTEFNGLRKALIRIADTGSCDRSVLQDGEEILQCLIRGLLQQEHVYKQQIAPAEACEVRVAR